MASLEEPKWPTRLKELILELHREASSKDEARGEALLLLNSTIFRYLHRHAFRFPSVGEDDLEDIASQKSLDLVHRAELGQWDPADRRGPEIMAYLSKVAERGLIDQLRDRGRRTGPGGNRPGWDDGPGSAVSKMESPDVQVERKEFARALRGCAEKLNPQSRVAWFLRIFCNLSTKEIAAHPDVLLTPSHVDVLMHRSRRSISDCMGKKGYQPRDMPPGTFAELWDAFQSDWLAARMKLAPNAEVAE